MHVHKRITTTRTACSTARNIVIRCSNAYYAERRVLGLRIREMLALVIWLISLLGLVWNNATDISWMQFGCIGHFERSRLRILDTMNWLKSPATTTEKNASFPSFSSLQFECSSFYSTVAPRSARIPFVRVSFSVPSPYCLGFRATLRFQKNRHSCILNACAFTIRMVCIQFLGVFNEHIPAQTGIDRLNEINSAFCLAIKDRI